MPDEKKDATGSDNTQDEDNSDLYKKTDDTGKDPSDSEDKKTDAQKSDKSFSQADLDAIVQKRLAKEKSKWEKEKDLPEVERLKKENQELAQKTRERDTADTFTAAAEAFGAKNVARLLKIYRADLEIGDDGAIENLDAVLTAAKNDLPEFFPSKTPGSADAAEGKTGAKLTLEQQVDAEFAKTGRTNAFKI